VIFQAYYIVIHYDLKLDLWFIFNERTHQIEKETTTLQGQFTILGQTHMLENVDLKKETHDFPVNLWIASAQIRLHLHISTNLHFVCIAILKQVVIKTKNKNIKQQADKAKVKSRMHHYVVLLNQIMHVFYLNLMCHVLDSQNKKSNFVLEEK